ncbi:MAG: cobalamin B12-binding domain-containing protein [Planctomycetes bacterium]|nr:cobalamin B12-binding domain-containing protein [Planctomycetota bacterium]
MTERRKNIKVLVGKPGLDGHDVGAKVIVRTLMDAGFDVVYSGLKKTPQEIIQAAVDEKVDVLGLSILSGSHIPICTQMQALMSERGLSEVLWIVGGNIPEQDHAALKEMGVAAVFAVGTPMQRIADFIRENVR